MRALSAESLLGLPVRLRGIRLGRPVDLLLDPAEWRVLGFDVRCGDGTSRFLAWTTVRLGEEALDVDSALLLLEDVDFYRTRARSLRVLRGAETELGPLRDVVVAEDGAVVEVVVGQRHVPPGDIVLVAEPSPTG
jgi:hypothetical protein